MPLISTSLVIRYSWPAYDDPASAFIFNRGHQLQVNTKIEHPHGEDEHQLMHPPPKVNLATSKMKWLQQLDSLPPSTPLSQHVKIW